MTGIQYPLHEQKPVEPSLQLASLTPAFGYQLAGVRRRPGTDRIISDERILGSSEFVASVLKHTCEDYEKRMRSKQISLSELIKVAAEYCNVDESLIKRPIKQRKVAQSRAIIIHIAVDRLWIAQAELARYLNITPSAVSKLAARGRIDPLEEKIQEKVFQAPGGPA